MKVNNSNEVTAPVRETFQEAAVVGGSSVRNGSNIAGPLRSVSFNRVDTWVAATPKVTSA